MTNDKIVSKIKRNPMFTQPKRKTMEMVRIDPSQQDTCIYHSSSGIRLFMPTQLLVDIPNDIRIGIQNGVLAQTIAELEDQMHVMFRILDETQKHRAWLNEPRKTEQSKEKKQ